MAGFNTKVTPEIENLTQKCVEHSSMDVSLYGKYDVKRGLRDINGKGVLAGLTQISNVQAVKVVDGKEVPCAGSLYYRNSRNIFQCIINTFSLFVNSSARFDIFCNTLIPSKCCLHDRLCRHIRTESHRREHLNSFNITFCSVLGSTQDHPANTESCDHM